MKNHFPVRCGLMDDDYFALNWMAGLVARDIRIKLCFAVNSPAELFQRIAHTPAIDLILLDAEYQVHYPPLMELITSIKTIIPHVKIVCLSQFCHPQTLAEAITAGVCGFFLKNEVRMEIGSALIHAMNTSLLVTAGVNQVLGAANLKCTIPVETIQTWIPNPHLSPQLQKVFNLRILYGMSTPIAAQEINLAPGTIEKYMQYVYQKLSMPWGDQSYLFGINLYEYPLDVQAFHQFSLPPQKNHIQSQHLNFKTMQ